MWTYLAFLWWNVGGPQNWLRSLVWKAQCCGDTSLERARYLKFQKQAAKGKIDPDRLPPTENATTQHSLRVHLQVVVWKHLNTSILKPIGRGWESATKSFGQRCSHVISPQIIFCREFAATTRKERGSIKPRSVAAWKLACHVYLLVECAVDYVLMDQIVQIQKNLIAMKKNQNKSATCIYFTLLQGLY